MGADPTAPAAQCPVTAALTTGTAVHQSGRGKAWHVKTGVPVNLYSMIEYTANGGGGAELVYPTTAWGKNYVAAVPPKGNKNITGGCGPQYLQVVAMADTNAMVVATADLPSGPSVAEAPPNVATKYTIAAGEFVQWEPPDYRVTNQTIPSMEASGSIVDTDQPVGIFGGSNYLCLQTATNGGFASGDGNAVRGQVPPVAALGHEYAAAPFATRRPDGNPETIRYRIVATVKGTTFTYDPPQASAPASLAGGQFADFETPDAFVIASQDDKHPFYVAQMMSGCNVISVQNPGCPGTSEYVGLPIPEQYLSSYVFFTVPAFSTTTLTVLRARASDQQFHDVSVDCLGAVGGWKPLGASSRYEWTTADLVRDGTGNKGCANGPHTARSDAPFGLVAWGILYDASYGYPAGTNLATINATYIPPLPR
jgi:hypothetical protein